MAYKNSKKVIIKLKDTIEIDVKGLNSEIGFLLRLAELNVLGDIISRLKKIDLRPVDLSALILINSNKNIRQLDLCDSLRIKKSNLVAFVDSLESRGLTIRRVSKTDRRVNFLEITPKGSKTLDKALKIQAEHREYIASKLTDVDLDNLILGLQKLADMNKKY